MDHSGNNNCFANRNSISISRQSPLNKYATYNVSNNTSYHRNYQIIHKTQGGYFELLSDMSMIRRTYILDGRREQQCYSRIINPDKYLEDDSVLFHWDIEDVKYSCGEYFIERQIDDRKRAYTGYLRIVKKTEAIVQEWARRVSGIDADRAAWMYFGKCGGQR